MWIIKKCCKNILYPLTQLVNLSCQTISRLLGVFALQESIWIQEEHGNCVSNLEVTFRRPHRPTVEQWNFSNSIKDCARGTNDLTAHPENITEFFPCREQITSTYFLIY